MQSCSHASLIFPTLLALGAGMIVACAQEAPPAPPESLLLQLRPLPMAHWLTEDAITVLSSPHDIGDLKDVFDGNDSTLLRSLQVNPQITTVQFDGTVSLAGTRVLISHHSGRWKLEGMVWAPGANAPTKYEIVPWTKATDGENNEIVFPRNIAVSKLTLTVQRIGGDEYVHLNEWELLSEVGDVEETPK